MIANTAPKERIKRRHFTYEPRHETLFKDCVSLNRGHMCGFLDLKPHELVRLRNRGFILEPTHKEGRAPQWKRKEVVAWLKANGPNRWDWKIIRKQLGFTNEWRLAR